MKFKETVESVKRIPQQIQTTMIIAIAAIVVAFVAMAISGMAVRRAN